MNKLIVEYDPENGQAFTDNEAKRVCRLCNKKQTITPHIVIGNELLITLFRCVIVEEKIEHTKIEFLFKGKIIEISKWGNCKEWPKGFYDTDMNAINILLTYQHEKAIKKIKHRSHKV